MKDKKPKKEELKNPNDHVTKQEFHNEINPMKKELIGLRVDVNELKNDMAELKTDVAELKVSVFDLRKDINRNHQLLISAMCQQTQKIIDHFEERFTENEQEHIYFRQRINI